MKKITLTIKSSEGLHARPASIFVKAASSFKSNIKIIKNDDTSKEYVGKSIISIMAMAAANGDKITIIADGEDEDIAINELRALVEGGF